MNLDLLLFNAINKRAKKYRILDLLGILLAEYAGYILLISLVVFAVIIHSWQAFLVPILAGLFARFVINEAIYVFYKRKRPSETLNIVPLVKKPDYPAFPSGHTSFFFALSFSLFLFNVPLALVFVVVSCLISSARVFCGVHWPSDILAGIVAAAITYLITKQLI